MPDTRNTRLFEILDKISRDNDDLRRDVASLSQNNRNLSREMASLHHHISTRLEGIETTVDAIQEKVEEIETTVDAIQEKVEEIETTVEAVQEKVEGLENTIERNQVQVEEDGGIICTGIASLRKDLDNLQKSQPGYRWPAEFLLFKKLPPELRLRIWKMACFHESRIIRMECIANAYDQPHFFHLTGFPVPSVLHTTSESRTEALKWYERKSVEFGKHDNKSRPAAEGYFNFKIDVLNILVDDDWKTTFPHHNWAEIVTKHRTFREFRRIAIPHQHDVTAFGLEWLGNAEFLLKPRSKIEEILVINGGTSYDFRIEQELIPVRDEYMTYQLSSQTDLPDRSVSSIMASVFGYLDTVAARGVDEDDGDIEEDAISDDEAPQSISRKDAVSDAADGSEAGRGPTNKPLPVVRFMGLQDRQSMQLPKIHFD